MPATEPSFSSTTWTWKRVRIASPPEANVTVPLQRRRWFHLPQTDWRRPITLTVKYRGGDECWFEVHSRGSMKRVHGATALVDLMREICRQ